MTITGKIFDAVTGAALPGATVAVVARSGGFTSGAIETVITGTTTANDGSFRISVSSGQVVRISYIGYRTQYPTLREGSENQIHLQPDTYQLGEAVVTANKGMSCKEGVEIFCKNSFHLVGYDSNEACLKRELPAQCASLSFWAKVAIFAGVLVLIGGTYYVIKRYV